MKVYISQASITAPKHMIDPFILFYCNECKYYVAHFDLSKHVKEYNHKKYEKMYVEEDNVRYLPMYFPNV